MHKFYSVAQCQWNSDIHSWSTTSQMWQVTLPFHPRDHSAPGKLIHEYTGKKMRVLTSWHTLFNILKSQGFNHHYKCCTAYSETWTVSAYTCQSVQTELANSPATVCFRAAINHTGQHCCDLAHPLLKGPQTECAQHNTICDSFLFFF